MSCERACTSRKGPAPVEYIVVKHGSPEGAHSRRHGRHVQRPDAGREDDQVDNEPQATNDAEANEFTKSARAGTADAATYAAGQT